jgi:hypothetical protein
VFIGWLVLGFAASALFLVGVAAILHGSRRSVHHQRDLQMTRAELRQQRINAKHTKSARARHDKAEAALFAVIKVRDMLGLLEEHADNAAEHLSQVAND